MLPWTRAPFLLLRQPGLVLAIAAGAFVAVLPAAAAPLFLSSARTATLHNHLDNTCAARAGLQVQSRLTFLDAYGDRSVTRVDPATATANYERRRATVGREAAATPGMATPTVTVFAATAVNGARRGGQDVGRLEGSQVWVAGRDGVTGKLTPVRGPDGSGLWVPERFATRFGLSVGDELTFAALQLAPSNNGPPTDPAARPAPMRIAAVYAELTTVATDEYWCTLQGIYGYLAGAALFDQTILPVLYTDVATVVGVGVTSPLNIANEYLDIPLADQRPTVPEAHVQAGHVDALRGRLLRGHPDGGWLRPTVLTSVGRGAQRAELVHGTLRDTTAPATAAGVLIGLIVVASAAVYWVQRREREIRVLAAHGVDPAALGLKAVLEAGPALVVGAAAAVVAAGALVRAFGPSPEFSAEAWPFALLIAALGLLAVLGVTLAGAVLRIRRMTDVARRRRRLPLRWMPWELLPAGLAALTWWLLGGGRERSALLGSVVHVPLRLVVVPVLGFLALVGLGARLGAWWITRSAARRSASRATARRPGLFLALRRIARPVTASVLLGAVTAIPVAMTGFGATVTDSIRLTLDAKAAVILGSETVASLDRDVPVPPELADRATPVLRLSRVLVGGIETDVLGIDPATFARGAFWSGQLPGPSLDELVAGLSTDRSAGIAYGPLPAGTHDVRVYGERQFTVSVRTTRLLPGSQGGYPVLLVHRDALGPATRWAVPQLWIRGDAAADLARTDAPVRAVTRTTDTFDDSLYEPVTYTFRYLIALNLFAGLVVAAGLLLYVEARTPVYRRGYVILRRLGLRRRAHAVALVLETAVPMGAGLLFGLLLAGAATAATRSELDLAPGSPPGPLIAVPTGVLATVLAVVVAIAAVSSIFAHVRTVRAKPGEVLRTV
jgi:putative ABC transport system permease protein